MSENERRQLTADEVVAYARRLEGDLAAAQAQLAVLKAELEQRYYDLLMAKDWIQALNSTHTLPALIDALTQPLVALLGACTALVFPWDHATGTLGTVLGYGLPIETPRRAALRTSALTATILAAGRLWEAADLQATSGAEAGGYHVAQALGWRALAGVPLLARGERVGALYVAWDVPHPLDKRERMLVETMAQYIAVALVNARRYA
jgi:GAF domain-containing protein